MIPFFRKIRKKMADDTYIMKTKSRSIVTILTLLIFLLSIATIQAQKYNVKNGTASFKAKISFNSYTGTSDKLEGFVDFDSNTLEFTIPTKSIETPNKKRNKHMYALINADEFKTVTFKGTFIDNFDVDKKEKQTIKINGDFTLAGVTNKIELNVDLTLDPIGLHFNAAWILLITDYNVEPPSKAFMTVKDEHEMTVDALLKIE